MYKSIFKVQLLLQFSSFMLFGIVILQLLHKLLETIFPFSQICAGFESCFDQYSTVKVSGLGIALNYLSVSESYLLSHTERAHTT